MQERDFRELAELDRDLIARARDQIRDQPASPETERLIEFLEELMNTRLDKIMRLATKNDLPDLECAMKEEVELYFTIRESLETCAKQLGIDLNGGGYE